MRHEFLIDVLGFTEVTISPETPNCYTKIISEDGVGLEVYLNGYTLITYAEGDQHIGIGIYNEETLNELIIILELGLNAKQ
jgi:hypothetical protein